MTQVSDARGAIHAFTFDARNAVQSYTDPLQQAETYTYDANHNLATVTDRNGKTRSYAYDHRDRLSSITYADGSSVAYTYDVAGRLTRAQDSQTGALTFAYDDFDRLITAGSTKGTVSYTYYSNGLRKTTTVSGQPVIRYTYDDGNRLTRIDQDAGSANNNVAQAVQFSYDDDGKRTLVILPNNIAVRYAYDVAGRLAAMTYLNADGSTLGDINYGYDAIGRRTTMGGSLARMNLPAAVPPGSVDAGNRLVNWNGKTITFDRNGNMTGDGTNTYVWDVRDRLVQIRDAGGGQIASFTYDAVGRRLTRDVNGNVMGYVYDGANVVQALNGAAVDNSQPGNVLATYITGLGIDELFAAQTGTGASALVTSYLTDALGSTLRLADGNGAKLVDYSYEPYGATTADAAHANPFQYTGRENDGTGFYYYRARYYSPEMARFISADPLGLSAGLNFYSYVEGNPITYVDPLGLRVSEMYRPLAGGAYPIWYHTAVNVNGEIYGFHPEGVRRENPADYENWGGHEKVIYPDNSQDARILKYLRDAAAGKNPKFNDHNYDAWNNNCFDFARGAYGSK